MSATRARGYSSGIRGNEAKRTRAAQPQRDRTPKGERLSAAGRFLHAASRARAAHAAPGRRRRARPRSGPLAWAVRRMSGSAKDGPSATASFGFQEVKADEKEGMVREVFEKVAPSYDIMNDLMSGECTGCGKIISCQRWASSPDDAP